jgi:elongator complex protein 2
VTGADEKELRAFDAPLSALRLLKAFACIERREDKVERVERAFIPSLGLTNKATAADGAEEDDNDSPKQEESMIHFPLERDLGAVSIWPEVRKLFGHNTELYRLASTVGARSAGSLYTPSVSNFYKDILVASSCKARDLQSAAIRVWDVEANKCIQVLTGGHKSTVATMSFSPDGQYLVSSGKDRRLCLWKRSGDEFSLVWAKDSAHKRIVWSVHVCPFDEKLIVSGSRDGCVKIWNIEETDKDTRVVERASFAPSFHRGDGKPDAVTAVAFAPRRLQKGALLALGLESGRIEFWYASEVGLPELCKAMPSSMCHCAIVTKLAWRPLRSQDDTLCLASSSMDHGCHFYSIKVQ